MRLRSCCGLLTWWGKAAWGALSSKGFCFSASPLPSSLSPTYLSEWHLNPKSKHGGPQGWSRPKTPQITATNETLIDYSLSNNSAFELISHQSARCNGIKTIITTFFGSLITATINPPVGCHVWYHICSPSCDSCRRCGEQTLSNTAYICTVCPRCEWSYEPSPGPDAWTSDCRSRRYTVASLIIDTIETDAFW